MILLVKMNAITRKKLTLTRDITVNQVLNKFQLGRSQLGPNNEQNAAS